MGACYRYGTKSIPRRRPANDAHPRARRAIRLAGEDAVQRFGPISKHTHQPAIDTLEQMRKLRIVVMRGSPTYDYLIRNNFKAEQILIESSIESMFKALEKGFVDVIYGSEQINTAVMQIPAANKSSTILAQRLIWGKSGSLAAKTLHSKMCKLFSKQWRHCKKMAAMRA